MDRAIRHGRRRVSSSFLAPSFSSPLIFSLVRFPSPARLTRPIAIRFSPSSPCRDIDVDRSPSTHQFHTMAQILRTALAKVGDVLTFNQATLSGAIDIIVVDTPPLRSQLANDPAVGATAGASSKFDSSSSSSPPHAPSIDCESLVCTPFHVRFGKLQLFHSHEKLVTLRVNEVPMEFAMKLGKDGEAYFILPTNEPFDREAMASPMASPDASPQLHAAPNARLPELDLLAAGATSPPASGDALAAAIRASDLTAAQGKAVLSQQLATRLADLPGVEGTGGANRVTTDSLAKPWPERYDSPASHPGASVFQVGFGGAPQLVGVSGGVSDGPRSIGIGGLIHPTPIIHKKSWMRSIFGMFGSNSTSPELKAQQMAVQAEHDAQQMALLDDRDDQRQPSSTEPLSPTSPSATSLDRDRDRAHQHATLELEAEERSSKAADAATARPQQRLREPSARPEAEQHLVATTDDDTDPTVTPRDASPSIPANASSLPPPTWPVVDGSTAHLSVSPAAAPDTNLRVDTRTSLNSTATSSAPAWPASLGPFPWLPLPSAPAPTDDDAHTPIRLSMCAPFLLANDGGANEIVFRKHAISYAAFCAAPTTLIAHPNLAVLHVPSRMIYLGRLGIPMLIGQLAFNKPLQLQPSVAQALELSDSIPSSPVALPAPLSAPHSITITPPPMPTTATANASMPHHRAGAASVSEGVTTNSASSSGAASGERVGWREWFSRGRKVGSSTRPHELVSTNNPNSLPDGLVEVTSPGARTPIASGSASRAESPTSPRSERVTGTATSTVGSPSSVSSSPRSGRSDERSQRDIFPDPTSPGVWLRKTKRPSVSQLQKMNLKYGRNRIVFTVNSALQGMQSVESSIFLLRSETRLVVSDIDGTITKSDVLGTLMPLLGRDWSHAGVARLYASIAANGFQMIYLTSRAIGQANITRSYIRGLKQDGQYLPEGPILMSPDRLMASFRREVIDRQPQLFKITSLTQVKHLFPPHHQPFFSGFGNRVTDILSYKAVGIPLSKIFIINPQGNIQSVNNRFEKTYGQLGEMVDFIFPARDAHTVERMRMVDHRRTMTSPTYMADTLSVAGVAPVDPLAPEQIIQQLANAEAELAGQLPIANKQKADTNILQNESSHIPRSTDADVSFNSFAYWRDEPVPLRPLGSDVDSDSDVDDVDGADSSSDDYGTDHDGSDAPSPPSAPRHADSSVSAPIDSVAFAARVQKQVEAGSAEAAAQAAVAEAIAAQDSAQEVRVTK